MHSRWPAYMTKKTLWEYLEIDSDTSWQRFKNNFPDFPKKHRLSCRWYRKEVDIFLDKLHHLSSSANDTTRQIMIQRAGGGLGK